MDDFVCFYNGEYIEKKNLGLSVDDLGFTRGYAVFEHCRTYQRKLFHLKEHLIRFIKGAQSLFIPVNYEIHQLEKFCEKIVHANPFDEVGLKIYATPGPALQGLTPIGQPTLLINPYPLPKVNFSFPQKGLTLKTTSYKRSFPLQKTTFYLPGLIAKQENPYYDDILFTDDHNHLLESTTSAFLGFKEGVLFYPEGALLKSVTQEVLVHLAKKHFQVKKEAIHLSSLQTFSELFLASSSKEILPIQAVDNCFTQSIDSYENTKKLHAILQEYIMSENWPILKTFL